MTGKGDQAELVERLFHEALEHPPNERLAWVRRQAEPDVAAEVARLLEADRQLGNDHLTERIGDATTALLDESADLRGRVLGPYRIISRLGAGGMGVVYRAERPDVGATVAVKVLRDPLSAEATRRFLDERRVLAKLRHPGIAQLFDAGADETGNPWFAMEFVTGQPLLAHCDSVNASVLSRLALFRQVLEAVQYAHRQLVVHRDLKPSNVVVTADGVVKLIDFGVAAGLSDPLGDVSGDGARALTPAYSAPEQLAGEPASVQSDVYSLGVLLYQLLTGRLPAAPDAPSLGPAPPNSGVDWTDLATICRTAMARVASHRYGSIEAIIRDLDRLLGEQPLESQPAHLGYRLRKFSRRRGREAAVAILLSLAAVAATASYASGLRRARAASETEASRALRMQRMLVDLLQGGDDAVGPADSLRVITLIDRGVEQAASLTNDPLFQAELYETLGTVLRQLGRLDQSDSLLQLSLGRRREIQGPEHPDLANSYKALALLRTDQAQFPEARQLALDAIAVLRGTPRATANRLAEGYDVLAEVEEQAGKYHEAIAALKTAIEVAGPAADTSADAVSRWYALASNHYYAGQFDTAKVLNQKVLQAWTRTYGESHPSVAEVLVNLGAIEQDRRQFQEAEAYYQRAMKIMNGWYGPDHLRTAATIAMLGRVALLQKQSDRADSLIRRALATRQRILGPDHPRVGLMLNELANIAFGRDRLTEAESLFVAAIKAYDGAYKGPHQYTASAVSGLASVYLAQREPVRAERAARDAIAVFERTLTPGHLNVGIARIKLGRALLRQNRAAAAEPELRTGLGIVRKEAGPTAPWVRGALEDLVTISKQTGNQAALSQLQTELASLPPR